MPQMTDCETSTTSLETFVNTGRTGRRNALPDILDAQHAAVGTSDITFDLSKLSGPSDDSEDKKSNVACADPYSADANTGSSNTDSENKEKT